MKSCGFPTANKAQPDEFYLHNKFDMMRTSRRWRRAIAAVQLSQQAIVPRHHYYTDEGNREGKSRKGTQQP